MEGPIPSCRAFLEASFDSLRNNRGLCGNIAHLQTCPKKPTHNVYHRKNNYVLVLIVLLVFGAALFIAFPVGIFLFSRSSNVGGEVSQTKDLFAYWSFNGKIRYTSIIEATNDFDSRHRVGVGGSASAYKAELLDEKVVAVKKLHALDDENGNFKGLTNEIDALIQIRHRNIVKLYGYCLHVRHYSFLVYEFLEGGSLQTILSDDDKATTFDWMKRVTVLHAPSCQCRIS